MSRFEERSLVLSAATGAVFSTLVPVAAFVLLSPAQYGRFSIPYLFFALGLSLQLSLISEAWIRTGALRGRDSTWSAYSGALVSLTAAFAVTCSVVLAAIPTTRDLAVVGAAIFVALLRSGVRYHAVARGRTTRVIASDIAGSVAFVALLVPGVGLLGSLTAVVAAWTTSAALSTVVLPFVRLAKDSSPARWLATHRASIRPLLADSLLLDAGSIGTPILLAPALGPVGFGIYRGISNVALPARLVVDPLRPKIAGPWGPRLLTTAGMLTIFGVGALLGVGCFVILVLAVPAIGVDLGTLDALVPYALPCAIYVTTAFIGQVYYVSCRGHLATRRLVAGRILQTIVAIALPLAGLWFAGLSGAIWGFVGCTALTAAVWFVLARSGGPDDAGVAIEVTPIEGTPGESW